MRDILLVIFYIYFFKKNLMSMKEILCEYIYIIFYHFLFIKNFIFFLHFLQGKPLKIFVSDFLKRKPLEINRFSQLDKLLIWSH
jgi:hypothetical protein